MTDNNFTIPENWQVERAAAAKMKEMYGLDDQTASYAGSLLVKKKTAILQELIAKYAKPRPATTATTATAPVTTVTEPEQDDFITGWNAGAQPGTQTQKETRIEPGEPNSLYDPSDQFLRGWYAR